MLRSVELLSLRGRGSGRALRGPEGGAHPPSRGPGRGGARSEASAPWSVRSPHVHTPDGRGLPAGGADKHRANRPGCPYTLMCAKSTGPHPPTQVRLCPTHTQSNAHLPVHTGPTHAHTPAGVVVLF